MEPPKDTESYIHWSGRTARAGADGNCITFYTSSNHYLLTKIESEAGIKIKTVGVPQPADIIAHAADDVFKGLW